MSRMVLGIVSAALIAATGIASAKADLITIGVEQPSLNGGKIDILTSGSGTVAWGTTYGGWTASGSASDTLSLGLPEILNSLGVASERVSGLHHFTIWIVAQNLNNPTSLSTWTSSLESNGIPQTPGGWSLSEAVFHDPTNGGFVGCTSNLCTGVDPAATQLYSTTFTSATPTTSVSTETFAPMPPFSIFEKFSIVGTWDGNTQHTHVVSGTIDLSATPVPEPTSLALLGGALLGLGIFRKGRRKLRM